ncbi:hypothetical protein [Clostridium sp.]|uniref:hypothetical protein n=1 Tax=Clostridium sp. TaxID=1506 RepID=UPI0032170954
MSINYVHCDKTQRIIKEFNYTNELCIAKCKPPIKKILDVSVKVLIVEKKIIDTCTGFKLCIKGCKVIKIDYESCDCSDKIINDKFICPFFELISLDLCTDILDVSVEICYCDANVCGGNSIWVHNSIAVCLLVAIKCNSCNCNCDDDILSIDCCNPTKDSDFYCNSTCSPLYKDDKLNINPDHDNYNETPWNFKNDFLQTQFCNVILK